VSWDIRVGHAEQITVYDGGEVMAAVRTALSMDGRDAAECREKALNAWNSVNNRQRTTWSLILSDGRTLNVWDSSPAPEYDKRCGDLTRDGAICGRYLNHPGEC
jgi:hypothetical protein